MDSDRHRWNRKHTERNPHLMEVNPRLVSLAPRLTQGLACDIAMGIGQNAAWLEARGWTVVGLDLSDVAIRRAGIARRVHGDALHLPLRRGRFDLVVCTFFFDRRLLPVLRALVRPGGTVFHEVHDLNFRKYRPDFPERFCARPGELEAAFAGFEVLHHGSGDTGGHTFETIAGRRPASC